jgi:hypothetical protein
VVSWYGVTHQKTREKNSIESISQQRTKLKRERESNVLLFFNETRNKVVQLHSALTAFREVWCCDVIVNEISGTAAGNLGI